MPWIVRSKLSDINSELGGIGVRIASEATIDLIERLQQQAVFFASNLARELPAVIAEKERLEKLPADTSCGQRLLFLKKEYESAVMARVRLEIYDAELRRHPPFCPYCWMLEGRRSTLKSTFAELDALACEFCG